jgi:transposase InsO family protein
VIVLIQQMARENRLWGAERIRGELLKLGFNMAKRTIQRHLRATRPPSPPRGQSWHSLLRNHTVWACDFLQVYDIWFRPLFAFFIVDINTKRVIHVAVTRHPTQQWTAQQIREATPFGEGPLFLIRDRDDNFGPDFDRAAKGAGIRIVKTAVRAPLMNSVVERFPVASDASVGIPSSFSVNGTCDQSSTRLFRVLQRVSTASRARKPFA